MVNFLSSAFSVFEARSESSACERKSIRSRYSRWTSAVRKVVTSGSMRRFQELILGSARTGVSNSTSDIWLLGVCYKISQDDSFVDLPTNSGLADFEQDFSSRILMTYRKGFSAIGDLKYTSDVNWGCMLRSSQMLVAQALLFHRLGRSWRRPLQKPLEQEYIDILHLFGDSEASPFSIHNLLQAGKAYNLTAGSWVGPYAMCRSWETLVRNKREADDFENQPLPMAVYVVSGEEDGERGGAPVVCVEDALRHCYEFSRGQANWTPILLLVPLVLGLETINPRYIPALRATFTFPQSIGIMGGRPGASTYIVGVQDEKAFYLDPHECQPVVDIDRNNVEADTSSYHSSVVRHVALESIDPSLAIGFYCRDKDDFDDFCFRGNKLAEESKGAPLFTVTRTKNLPKSVNHSNVLGDSSEISDSFDALPSNNTEDGSHEDDWQLL
ncbi:Peptidase C [Trema orientale]|uniref:Cysteine protease n=1 Tax=Trema orientale TaxID=63057 RepID=A0A2P5EMU8_TREOI|nr:Peptidase C [Trema orientale]